jgi:hypothetical protein
LDFVVVQSTGTGKILKEFERKERGDKFKQRAKLLASYFRTTTKIFSPISNYAPPLSPRSVNISAINMTEPKVVSNIVKIRKSALKRKERSENKSRKRAFRPSDGKKKKKKKKKRKIGKKFKTSGVVISRYVFF